MKSFSFPAALSGLLLLTAIPPTGAQVPTPLGTTKAAQQLSLDRLEGLYVAGRRLSATSDTHGRQDGKVVAAVVLYNHTPYALSHVTLRLDLYGTGADANRVISSLTYTAGTLKPPAAGQAPAPLAPNDTMTASSDPLAPHLSPGQESGGYWMQLVSAEGTASPPNPAWPPLVRLTQAVDAGDMAAAQAVEQTHPEMIRAGRDSSGQALLSGAARGDHAAMAAYLLARGAAVDGPPGPTRSGMTPLQWAVNWGSARVVDLLLAHHPDLSRKDGQGRTPLDNARRKALAEGAGAASQHILTAL